MSADFAAEGEDGGEVDLEHLVPVAVGELMARVSSLDAGTVDEDVDPVAVAEDGGDEGGDGGLRGEVSGVDGCRSA